MSIRLITAETAAGAANARVSQILPSAPSKIMPAFAIQSIITYLPQTHPVGSLPKKRSSGEYNHKPPKLSQLLQYAPSQDLRYIAWSPPNCKQFNMVNARIGHRALGKRFFPFPLVP
ncbi:MAG: hypothetical protein ACR2LR_04100 [Hassallia sp.]